MKAIFCAKNILLAAVHTLLLRKKNSALNPQLPRLNALLSATNLSKHKT
jgi:hypothetical protein